MGGENPSAVLYDVNGTALAVQNATAIPASTPALMFAGSDGTNSRYALMDSSGRLVMVGAGTAGTPTGGVVSIQGVASGTAIPISGTVSISGTVGVTQSTSPWVDNITQFGGNNVVTGTGASGLGIPRVTVSNDSNVLVTQSTSPWVDNITQFGGTNISTGTGAGGAGIPRVTVSNDSNILATQSGTWTVQQGSPPWTVSQATAANLNATVVGLGTAGSPTGGILSTQTPDTTSQATLNALNAAVSIALVGTHGAGMQLLAGTLQGTIVPEISYDGGTTWVASFFVDPTTTNVVSSIVFGSNNTATARTLIIPAGASNARVRVSAFTSGTATCNLRSSFITEPPLAYSGAPNAVAPPSTVQIGGNDGSNLRTMLMDASGHPIIVGDGVAGTPAGGVVSIQGVSGGTTVPVSGTVAVTQSTSPWVANITQFGSNNVVTGTGASGVGIPRVTVSNDSNILATQSGTWTVAQGAPNSIGNSWPTEITDGTHGPVAVKAASTAAVAADPSLVTAFSPNSPLPSGTNTIGIVNQGTAATLANAWSTKITDTTNGPVAVKAASTAPVNADQALVVVLSPNQQPIPVTGAPANAVTGLSFGRAIGASNTLVALRATTYTEQTTNFTGSVKSTSANDASAGTGARTVIITYYDQTGAGPNTETVTLNGTTAVNLVNTNHCFIEKMVVVTVGSTGSNAGTISLFTGAAGAGTTVGSIGFGNLASGRGDNATLWAHHYTPTGKTTSIYLINGGTTGNQNADVSLYSIPVLTANAAEIKVSDSIIVGQNSDSVSRSSLNPLKITGFARTTMYAVGSGGGTSFSGGFDYSDQ